MPTAWQLDMPTAWQLGMLTAWQLVVPGVITLEWYIFKEINFDIPTDHSSARLCVECLRPCGDVVSWVGGTLVT